jgi:hypothetical protein
VFHPSHGATQVAAHAVAMAAADEAEAVMFDLNV